MYFKELEEQAKVELEVEKQTLAKEKIKERLKEIELAKRTLNKLEKQYSNLLEEEVEEEIIDDY